MQRSSRRWLGLLLAALGLLVGGFVILAGSELFLAQQAAGVQDWRSAAQHYRAAAAFLPWQADLWSQAGRHSLAAGDYALAVQDLTRAEPAGARSGADWLLLGDAYRGLFDYANAETAWTRAIAAGQTDASVYRRLLDIHQQMADYPAEAEDRKALALVEPASAENYLRLGKLLCALEPEASMVYLEQVAALSDQPAAAQAVRLQQAVRSGLLSEEPGFVFLETGRALAGLGEWDLARTALHTAVDRSPGLAEGWAYLAEMYQQGEDKNMADAQAALEKAARLAPDSLAVNALWALFWQRQGKAAQALPYLEKCAQLEPANPLWLVSIGQAQADLGDIQAAEGYFRSAAALSPAEPEYQRLLAEFFIQYQIKIDDAALPAAREAARLSPQDPAAQDVLGQALFLSGDLAGALQAYQAALALDENYAPASLHLAVLYTEQGQTELARQALQKAYLNDQYPQIQAQAERLLP